LLKSLARNSHRKNLVIEVSKISISTLTSVLLALLNA
jgi:hypothetical protein